MVKYIDINSVVTYILDKTMCYFRADHKINLMMILSLIPLPLPYHEIKTSNKYYYNTNTEDHCMLINNYNII